MTDITDRLQEVFRGVLNLPAGADASRCRQVNTPEWDSLTHVSLVLALEGEFGVAIDVGDSLTLTSYEAARIYLEEKLP